MGVSLVDVRCKDPRSGLEAKSLVIGLDAVEVERGGRKVLGPISLQIGAAEHVVVFGPNGCGKSTLLTVLSGRVWPNRGTLHLLGRQLGKSDFRQVRKAVGRVDYQLQLAFQQAAYRVEEVVCSGFFDSIGLVHENPDEIQQAAARSALAELGCLKFELGVFRELSYGEQKRVLLARALVHEPAVLLLDEPCEGLDIVAKQSFLEIVSGLPKVRPNLATIWSSHHLDEIPFCATHALLLDSGHPIYFGDVDQACTSARMSELFRAPIEVVEFANRKLLLVGKAESLPDQLNDGGTVGRD